MLLSLDHLDRKKKMEGRATLTSVQLPFRCSAGSWTAAAHARVRKEQKGGALPSKLIAKGPQILSEKQDRMEKSKQRSEPMPWAPTPIHS